MTGRSLLAIGLAGTLIGSVLSGCADSNTATDTATDVPGPVATSEAGTADASANTPTASGAVPAATGGGDFASAWGPGVGTTIPMLAATDHKGTAQNLASLSGNKGLLLVFSRSADW